MPYRPSLGYAGHASLLDVAIGLTSALKKVRPGALPAYDSPRESMIFAVGGGRSGADQVPSTFAFGPAVLLATETDRSSPSSPSRITDTTYHFCRKGEESIPPV
jgi:hypothetical protein